MGVYKYDRQGRPVQQGLYINTAYTDRASLQLNVIDPLYAASTDLYFESSPFSNQVFPITDTEILIRNFYDVYMGPPFVPKNIGEGTPANPRGLLTHQSRRVLGTDTWLSSYLFYDVKGRIIQLRNDSHHETTFSYDLTTRVYDFEGKVTATQTEHNVRTSGAVVILNRMFYDHAGRLKQVYQKINDGPEVLAVQYNYNALGMLKEKNLHCTVCAAPDLETGEEVVDIIEKAQYNPSENDLMAATRIRLKNGYKVQNGNTLRAHIGRDVVLAEATYTPDMFLQSVDYRYNRFGLLKSINNAKLTADALNDDTNDYFGMELKYKGPADGNSTDGTIAGVQWKGAGAMPGSVDQLSYEYTYDKAGRLKQAVSKKYDGTAWTKEEGAFNETLTYDHNGNIKTLQRNQRKYELTEEALPSYGHDLIDDLTYAYNASMGDQLIKVEDAATNPFGFDNGSSSEEEDYTYDVNGNLTSDKNKGIDAVIYNVLGKPETIEFTDGRRITYVYDAAGTKLRMTTEAGGSIPPLTTDYVGGFVYENGTLSFFSSPEGRVAAVPLSPGEGSGMRLEYQYAIGDHQGNTRVLFTSAEPEPDISFTDFEAETNDDFENYPTGGARSSWDLFNKTEPAPPATRSQLLNAGHNSQVGVAKSFKVYPGDKLKIEAYAKYYNGNSGTANLSGFASALTAAFGLSPTDVGEAALAYTALDAYGAVVASGDGPGANTHPKAFVNILLFDKDHNFLDIAFEQIDGGEQTGATVKAPHDYMMREVTVKETGYAYVYVSNENHSFVEVYFDDVTIAYTPSRVIQYNEYYPFGLQTSNSWTRANHSNNYLYNQGAELNKTSGWYETMFRNYDPAIGRFTAVDPLATMYAPFTGYNYGINNPVSNNDPSGANCNGPDCQLPSCTGPNCGPPQDWYDMNRGGGGSYYSYVNNNVPDAWGYLQSHEQLLEAARHGDMDAVRQYIHMHGEVYTYTLEPFGTYIKLDGREVLGSRTVDGYTIVAQQDGNCCGDNKGTYMAAALVASGALLVDDASVVGVADDILIPFLIAGAYIADLKTNAGKGNANYPGPLSYTVPDPTTVPKPYVPPGKFPEDPSGNVRATLITLTALQLMQKYGYIPDFTSMGMLATEAYNNVSSFYSNVKNEFLKGIEGIQNWRP